MYIHPPNPVRSSLLMVSRLFLFFFCLLSHLSSFNPHPWVSLSAVTREAPAGWRWRVGGVLSAHQAPGRGLLKAQCACCCFWTPHAILFFSARPLRTNRGSQLAFKVALLHDECRLDRPLFFFFSWFLFNETIADSLKQAGPVPQRDVYFTVVTVITVPSVVLRNGFCRLQCDLASMSSVSVSMGL